MGMGWKCVAMAATWLLAVAPAVAAQTIIEGSGRVIGVFGLLIPGNPPAPGPSPNGIVTTGDSLTFRLVLDTGSAPRVFDGGRSIQVFEPTSASLSFTVGDYVFNPVVNSSNSSRILLGSNFRLFPGGSSTEPIFNQQFSFNGFSSGQPPFAMGSPAAVTFDLVSTFRQNLNGATPTLADLRSPDGAFYNDFRIGFRDANGLQGVVLGNFTGTFAAAVPEAGTWGLLILGFGVVGGAMRARRSARTVPAA